MEKENIIYGVLMLLSVSLILQGANVINIQSILPTETTTVQCITATDGSTNSPLPGVYLDAVPAYGKSCTAVTDGSGKACCRFDVRVGRDANVVEWVTTKYAYKQATGSDTLERCKRYEFTIKLEPQRARATKTVDYVLNPCVVPTKCEEEYIGNRYCAGYGKVVQIYQNEDCHQDERTIDVCSQNEVCVQTATSASCKVQPDCLSDSDCTGGKICVGGDCVYECQSASDCDPNQICKNNKCEAAPTITCGDGTCEGSETCTTCPSDCGNCQTLKPNGETCLQDNECSSNHCVHETCRATEIYCGDGFCDETENCPEDCEKINWMYIILGVAVGILTIYLMRKK